MEAQQLGQDLQYLRQVVSRQDREHRGAPSLSYLWAAYVLIGYTLIDSRPEFAGPFFAIGGFAGGIVSWWIGRRYSQRVGESDRSFGVRALGHFGGGIVLAGVSCTALACVIESLRGSAGSQVFVVMIGLVYFLWGVQVDRYFLFLGPVLMAGGVLVGLLPHYGWMSLGAVIAAGLIVPTFFHRGAPVPPAAAVA